MLSVSFVVAVLMNFFKGYLDHGATWAISCTEGRKKRGDKELKIQISWECSCEIQLASPVVFHFHITRLCGKWSFSSNAHCVSNDSIKKQGRIPITRVLLICLYSSLRFLKNALWNVSASRRWRWGDAEIGEKQRTWLQGTTFLHSLLPMIASDLWDVGKDSGHCPTKAARTLLGLYHMHQNSLARSSF